jgi:hypothetical protein
MIYFNGIKLYFSLPAEKIDTLPRGRVRERGAEFGNLTDH